MSFSWFFFFWETSLYEFDRYHYHHSCWCWLEIFLYKNDDYWEKKNWQGIFNNIVKSFVEMYTSTTLFKIAYPNTYNDFKIRKCNFSIFTQTHICDF